MKVLHTYCLNYNLGDYFLGIGLKNLLRAYLDVDLIGETNIQGRVFDEYYIKEVVNKRYDLLVIGGGGIIHGKHWPNGWFWLIEKEIIKSIEIPFIVYGVGYNYWEEEGGIPERGIEHLKETIKHASYFSVRNDGSANRIQKQTGLNITAIPDPGFHINLNRSFKPKIEEPYAIIQLANDKPKSRFETLKKRDQFISSMKQITQNLSETHKVVFAPHVYDDILISEQIAKGIKNAEVWAFDEYAFDRAAESLGYYQFADFVIAMRGHGQIVPIAFNVPVISLENHPKHRGLMEELNLLEYNVAINSNKFKEDLLQAVSNVMTNKVELKEKYSIINNNLNNNSKAAFELIKQKINE